MLSKKVLIKMGQNLKKNNVGKKIHFGLKILLEDD